MFQRLRIRKGRRRQGSQAKQGKGVQVPILTNTVSAEVSVRWRKPVIGRKSEKAEQKAV